MTWKANRRREALELADPQAAVTRCAFCRWTFRGPIREGRRAFKTHRELKHGRRAA